MGERMQHQDESLQTLLDRIDSDEFNGIIDDLDGPLWHFTDERAEDLGRALLRNKDKIKDLTVRVHLLSDPFYSSWKYPSLVKYFDTSMPSESLRICGNPKEIGSYEIVDNVLSSMIKQGRPLPQIALRYISLSARTIDCLEHFSEIVFVKCDVHKNYANAQAPAEIKNPVSILRCLKSSAPLMKMFCLATSDTNAWTFHFENNMDLVETDQMREEAVHVFIQFLDSLRRYSEGKIFSIVLSNVDINGSRVVPIMLELNSLSTLVPMDMIFRWRGPGKDEHAIRSQAQRIVDAASHCRFHGLDLMFDSSTTSILDAESLETVKKISKLNVKLPKLIEDATEEYWEKNKWLIVALLHPERLLHPRFGDVLYRFLRKNIRIAQAVFSNPPTALSET